MLANRYKIIKQIGQGGMADVFLANDTILNREVALKILRGDLASDPVSLLRFKREAETISQLSHDNIVKIYDVGEADGQQFIAMEYIEGKTLKQLIISRGALYKEEAISIMKQLVSGVSAANEKGIIHRDLKPQNIIIKTDGMVKITDFGIAATQDAVQLTQADSVMGSIHYLAPEMARGDKASVQSDIYSLGIIMYELLTGDVPYRGKTTVEIAMMHLRDSIPSVKDFNPALPQAVENVVIKATTKNRDYRYQTAKEMYLDLLTVLSPEREHEPKIVIKDRKDDEDTLTLPTIADIPSANAKRNKIIIGVSVAFLAIFFFFVINGLIRKTPSNHLVLIPDVKGLSIVEATEMLEAEGFVVDLKKQEILTDDIDKNLVVATTPEIGSEADRGSKIVLTISRGKMFLVEDYKGMQLSALRELLKDTKIDIIVQTEIDNTKPEDEIIRQSGLTIGEKIDPNIRKEFVVVVARPAATMLHSAWIGMNVSQVEQILMDTGIKVNLSVLDSSGLTEEQAATITINTVIKMSPAVGTYYEQKEGKAVTLYYYKQLPVFEPEDD